MQMVFAMSTSFPYENFYLFSYEFKKIAVLSDVPRGTFGGFLRLGSGLLTTLTISLLFGLSACKKSDPVPELKDPVFSILGNEIKAAEADIAAAKIAVTDAEVEISKVVPQTGQIKYAKKRYWEARNRLTMAEQKLLAATTKAEMRKWKVRQESLEAFHKGKEWSGSSANDSYVLQKNLDQKSRNWSVIDRRSAVGLKSGRDIAAETATPASGGHGDAPADSGH